MTVMPVPGDAWAFANSDEDILDAEAAEEEAVHVRSTIDALDVLDEAEDDLVLTEDEDGPALALYEDEEGLSEEDADHELDLQEILEAQHYAFELEPQEGSA